MIQIIAGEKGKGKTKVLIEKANHVSGTAKGSVVYLDKNNKHMYELSNRIRLINVKDYCIENYSEFIGFICGLVSQDHDLEVVFLDSFLSIALTEGPNISLILEKLKRISELYQVDFVISISLNKDELPEIVKKDVLVSL
jgi:Ni2+-binding GTPase involved in maturation of urease and hydrogenase